jgi:hypothetical protein
VDVETDADGDGRFTRIDAAQAASDEDGGHVAR